MAWGDPGKVGDLLINYFWVVRGMLAGGESAPSNPVGEFDFSLAAGN